MSYNGINAEGAQLFAEALKVNTALSELKYAAHPHLPDLETVSSR